MMASLGPERTEPGDRVDAPAGSGGTEGAGTAARVRAAGGIVVRAALQGGWEVALVHRPQRLDWTLPKGKLELGESAEDGALREVAEETGWHCSLGPFVGEVEYEDSRGRPKVVSYWLMQRLGGTFSPNREVDELQWLPVEAAIERLSYDHDSELLASVAGALGRATPL